MKSKLKQAQTRWLLRLALEQGRLLLVGMFFLAVSSAALLAFPQVIRRIIDEALVAKDAATIDKVALLALLVFAAQSLAGAARYYCFTLAGERIVVQLRQRLFGHLLKQDVTFFDGQKIGELQSRLSADATVLQSAVSVNISMLVRNLAGAIGGIAMLVYTSPRLSIALLGAIPPIAAGVAFFGQRIRRISRQQQDAVAVSGGVANETLGGIRVVRAFGQETAELGRYRAAIEVSYAASKKKIHLIAYFTAAASMFGFGAIVGVLWYGSHLVISGAFSMGALTSFMLYTLSVAVSVGSLGGLWTDFMSASGASRRLFELLEQPEGETTIGTERIKVLGTVTFENVDFYYPTRPDALVLNQVSFGIEPGEMVALVGPSGSGKSTIAALMGRFYHASRGRVLMDGHDLTKVDPVSFRDSIGIVPQDPVLFSVSIEENIRFGRRSASRAEIVAAAQLANAAEFIDRFPQGYATLVGERGVQLSGGQRQRLAIARAAVRDPRILILDEATSALDAESEALVQEALERLMVGRTTVVIAHRLSTVRQATRILVLERGKIVQTGTHGELMQQSSGPYKRLVERQLS